MHGKPEMVDEYVSVGGHDYRPDLRVAIFRFINKHLKGDTETHRRRQGRTAEGVEPAEFPRPMPTCRATRSTTRSTTRLSARLVRVYRATGNSPFGNAA
jgi:hypothetical protein